MIVPIAALAVLALVGIFAELLGRADLERERLSEAAAQYHQWWVKARGEASAAERRLALHADATTTVHLYDRPTVRIANPIYPGYPASVLEATLDAGMAFEERTLDLERVRGVAYVDRAALEEFRGDRRVFLDLALRKAADAIVRSVRDREVERDVEELLRRG